MTSLGRYLVRGVLGRGNMGIVYRGYDPVIDRPVALKTVLLPDSLAAEERRRFLERFLHEARAAGKLLHPNVVVTYDAATDEATGLPFIAMELVEGESLRDRVSREGAIEWTEAVEIGIALAEALGEAHRSGIVHRDIKPANVLVDGEGRPKITDFGIAKLPAAGLTQEGIVIGTPEFMSPEQLRGEPLDGRSDLFSLGALLYTLVAGRSPFAGPDPATVFGQILHKEPRPLAEIRPGTPAALDAVLARALRKAREERYAAAGELAEDLRRLREGRAPLHARPRSSIAPPTIAVESPAGSAPAASLSPAAAAPSSRPRRRRILLVAAAAAAAVLAGAVALYRHDLARAEALWRAEGAADRGDFVQSEATLEEVLEADPDDAAAQELLARVSAVLLRDELPLRTAARHRHRLGHCSGELVLAEGEVEYRSAKHGRWAWPFEGIVAMERRGPSTIALETNEEELFGLVGNKRYVFELFDPLPEDFWKRYLRTFRRAGSP